MECNKGEAIRAKEIAEQKMQNRDFIGAKKMILKAQQLFPELENMSQMLTVCDVHFSAGIKVNGEMDWYGILQLEPTADDFAIKKQYRKLALSLHPDKNQFPGAEAAFKLIGEAQMTLSDKSKRYAYDIKRNGNLKHKQVRQQFHQSTKTSYSRTNNATVNVNGINSQQPSASFNHTFWTMCPKCGMRYQYYRALLRRALRCQNCKNTFVAEELTQRATPPATNSGQSWHTFINPQAQIPVQQAKHMNHQNYFGSSSSSMPFQQREAVKQGSGIEHRDRPINVVSDGKAGNNGEASEIHPEHSKNNEGEKAAKPSNAGRKRRRNMTAESSNSDIFGGDDINLEESGRPNLYASVAGQRRSARVKQKVAYTEDGNGDEEDLEDPLSHKNSSGETTNHDHEDTLPRGSANGEGSEVKKTNLVNENVEKKQKEGTSYAGLANRNECCEDQAQESKQFTYPDPEFYDFDEFRSASRFAVDQIWALYDNLDGMPRFYARIRKVFTPQFEVRYTWLEHNPRNEAESAWNEEELPVACGNFKLGTPESSTDRLIFSHIVSWGKGKTRNSYDIYPKKGEVWALFKNWKMEWSSGGDKNRSYEYEVVEVISDFSPENGIRVTPLVKINGFVSLFMPAEELAGTVIPASEILRFSHSVPAYRLTGNEREGVPQGSLELDSASLPPDFGDTFPSIILGSTSSGVEKLNECRKSVLDDSKDKLRTCGVHNVVNSVGDSSEAVKEDRTSRGHVSGACEHVDSGAKHLENESDEKYNGDGKTNDENVAEDSVSSPASALNDYYFDYPDPEFHDFNEARRIENFSRGQVWALYSDIDKYPKYYGWVKKVEVEQQRVHVAWLEACPTIEEEKRWLNEEMPVTCGAFKVSHDAMTFEGTDAFSHLVHTKSVGKKNQHGILPNCGEIWAMYKNWKPGWTQRDLEDCDYDVVEIRETTASSIKARLLEKVNGYRTVFKPEGTGIAGTTIDVRADEYIKFSHQVPAFLLTNEKGGKLRGYWELDPASVPELLLISDL